MINPVNLNLNCNYIPAMDDVCDRELTVTERDMIVYDEWDTTQMFILSSEDPSPLRYVLWSRREDDFYCRVGDKFRVHYDEVKEILQVYREGDAYIHIFNHHGGNSFQYRTMERRC